MEEPGRRWLVAASLLAMLSATSCIGLNRAEPKKREVKATWTLLGTSNDGRTLEIGVYLPRGGCESFSRTVVVETRRFVRLTAYRNHFDECKPADLDEDLTRTTVRLRAPLGTRVLDGECMRTRECEQIRKMAEQ